MHFSLLQLGVVLGLCATIDAASGAHGANAFKRVENKAPVIEKRTLNKPFENPRLQKRASPYLNNVTESRFCFPHLLRLHKTYRDRRVCRQWIGLTRCRL